MGLNIPVLPIGMGWGTDQVLRDLQTTKARSDLSDLDADKLCADIRRLLTERLKTREGQLRLRLFRQHSGLFPGSILFPKAQSFYPYGEKRPLNPV